MKRWIAGLVAVGFLGTMVLTAPKPAEAWSGRWQGQNHFWGGFAAGALTGVVAGGIFAPRVYYAPAPVYYQPAPVYVAPPAYYQPAPVYAPAPCQSYWVDGYWYGPSWVAGHWEQTCR